MPIPIVSRVFLGLLCTNCKILGLLLRSLVHFELILVQGDRHGAGRYILFLAPFVEEAVFSPLYVFGAFVKNKVSIAVWNHIWVLHSVPLVFISVFVPVPCCFYCYGSVIYFEVGYCDTTIVALFAQYCLGYSWSFEFSNEH
jgi:hypothetical protein